MSARQGAFDEKKSENGGLCYGSAPQYVGWRVGGVWRCARVRSFGHAGEALLDKLTYASSGRHFMHNIHSVRVLDKIFPYNITLDTLTGIAAHNGELELSEYKPKPIKSFEEFDRDIEKCYENNSYNGR